MEQVSVQPLASEESWVSVSAPPPTKCMTLGKWFNPLCLSFLIFQMGMTIISTLKDYYGIWMKWI